MYCEDCGCHLFLNDKQEMECQHCGKLADEVTKELVEELFYEKESL